MKNISTLLMMILLIVSCGEKKPNSNVKNKTTNKKQTGYQAPEPKIMNIEEFNWKVEIPKKFVAVDEKEWNRTLNKGLSAAGQIRENQTITLFSFRNRTSNSYEANWQPSNKTNKEYLKTNSELNKAMYETLKTQMPEAKLDSTSSIQKISGLDFQRFEISIVFRPGVKMKTISFSRLFDDKEFTMNITYKEENIGYRMLEAFLNSEFK